MNAGCAGKTEIHWERVPYLSALEVWSRQGAIQIHVYLTFTLLIYINGELYHRKMPMWSDTDDEPHCGVESWLLTRLTDDGLLQLHSADDNAVMWVKEKMRGEALQALEYETYSIDIIWRAHFMLQFAPFLCIL